MHWVDIDRYLVHSFDTVTQTNSTINVGEYVSTLVNRSPEKGGGLIIALTRSIAHLDLNSSRLTKICDVPEPLTNRMNDGKCDPQGRLWLGSLAFDFKEGAGSLYMLDTDCTLHKMVANVSISNGIAWSHDNGTMYYIDSTKNSIDAFDFHPDTGGITNRRQAVENIWGGTFDGMTIDGDDNLYVAVWGGSCVLKIDPRSAQLLGKISVPGVLNVTSCALGGANLRDLYITSSSSGADLSVQMNAGALFKALLPDVKGLPAFEFAG